MSFCQVSKNILPFLAAKTPFYDDILSAYAFKNACYSELEQKIPL